MIPPELARSRACWLDAYHATPGNPQVVVMYSGGRDSTLALAWLHALGIPVSAVHYRHRWSWTIPTREARRVTRELGIPLQEHDVTSELEEALIGNTTGRPCGACKTIMERHALQACREHDVQWLATGETSRDPALCAIAERASPGKTAVTQFFISRYLWSQAHGVDLPAGLHVLRPLVHLAPGEVAATLHEGFGLVVQRVHEYGDPYLDYTREGCPLHYLDAPLRVTRALLDRLATVNRAATRLARAHDTRAAVTLPSGTVWCPVPVLRVEIRQALEAEHGALAWPRSLPAVEDAQALEDDGRVQPAR